MSDEGQRRPGAQEEDRNENRLIAHIPPFALAPYVVKGQDLQRTSALSLHLTTHALATHICGPEVHATWERQNHERSWNSLTGQSRSDAGHLQVEEDEDLGVLELIHHLSIPGIVQEVQVLVPVPVQAPHLTDMRMHALAWVVLQAGGMHA